MSIIRLFQIAVRSSTKASFFVLFSLFKLKQTMILHRNSEIPANIPSFEIINYTLEGEFKCIYSLRYLTTIEYH